MAKTKTNETSTPTMNKMDAVRAAIRDGVAMPQAAAAHIKERYGIDISPNVFSFYKTKFMREQDAEAGSPEPAGQPEAVKQDAPEPAAPKTEVKLAAPKPPAPKPPKPEAKAPPKPEAAPSPTGSPADLARQVKQLVARHGAGAVADMVEVFKE